MATLLTTRYKPRDSNKKRNGTAMRQGRLKVDFQSGTKKGSVFVANRGTDIKHDIKAMKSEEVNLKMSIIPL